jgi:hypothetical protein
MITVEDTYTRAQVTEAIELYQERLFAILGSKLEKIKLCGSFAYEETTRAEDVSIVLFLDMTLSESRQFFRPIMDLACDISIENKVYMSVDLYCKDSNWMVDDGIFVYER